MGQDIEYRFAKMWRTARQDAGKSQDFIASKLGVSKKTIQNWESGYSCPSQLMGFKFFEALDLQPLPYYLQLLYGDFEDISKDSSDGQCRAALLNLINGLTPEMQRQLLFVLYGDHGGSLPVLINLIVAYLQIPLVARLSLAESVMTTYELADALGYRADHIPPDIGLLKEALKGHKASVMNNKKTYVGGMLWE